MSKIHVVKQGECLSLIARGYGYPDYKVIYNHPDNAAFKKKRPNPNVIKPGDEIVIPDKTLREENAPATQSHRYRLKIPGKVLRLKILDHEGKAIAGTSYTLHIAGEERTGSTDGTGMLREPVPMGTKNAKLYIEDRALVLQLGHLNPVGESGDADSGGIQGRLKNLGYDVGATDGRFGQRTRAALAVFQLDHGLEIDGEPNEATLAKLEDVHGC